MKNIILWENQIKRNYIHIFSAKLSSIQGSGISTIRSIAEKKAIFEAIERYCGSTIGKNLFTGSFLEFKSKAINPEILISLPKKPGKEYLKFKPNLEIEWVTGSNLITNDKVLLPAFSVYLNYNKRGYQKKSFSPITSSGLAVHNSFKKSVLNGIFELIERDGIMLAWLTKRNFKRISLNRISYKPITKLLLNIATENLKTCTLVLENDFKVPLIINILYDPKNNWPCVSFGSAAGKNFYQVVLKTIEESLMVRSTLEYMKEKYSLRHLKNQAKKLNRFLDHALLYAFKESSPDWRFWLQKKSINIKTIEKKFLGISSKSESQLYDYLINILRKKGFDTYSADITTKDINKLNLYVTKTIIPQLQNMEMIHKLRCVNYARINMPNGLINHLPHPFA